MLAALKDAARGFVSKLEARDGRALALAGAVVVLAGATLVAALPKKEVLSADQQALAAKTVEVDGKSVAVSRMTAADIPAAAATLAAGNAQDPLVVACGAASLTDATRPSALKWLYTVLLKTTVPASEGALTLRTASNDAVAIWLPKGRDVSFGALAANGAWQYLWRFSGWERRGRFTGYSDVSRSVRARLMEDAKDYYYLLTAAAKPGDSQDAALAAVILPVLKLADAKGVPCVAEASSPVVSRVLGSLGFQEVNSFKLSGVAVSNMRREPAAGQ